MPRKRKADAPSDAASVKKSRTSSRGNKAKSNDVLQPLDLSLNKKLLIKGKVPVDSQCASKVNCAHVLQENGDVYNFMLNQTNLQNNNNKYYMGQILEDDSTDNFYVWFRWGRVGKTASTRLQPSSSKAGAISEFMFKFRSKTGNHWQNRANFVKKEGYYDLVEQDFGEVDEAEDSDSSRKKTKNTVSSCLQHEVLSLILLISDVNKMEHQMREMNYDARRAPLGKLTVAQIKAGYSALNSVSECIEELEKITSGANGKGKRPASKKKNEDAIRARLLQACNSFYTRIPHDFGMRVPPLISTPEAIKTELELLKALEDIEVAFSIIKQPNKKPDIHPADNNYNNLNCEIKPITSGHKMDKIIKDYVRMTHDSSCNMYDLEVLQTFELNKSGEKEAFQDVGTRRLLWHGSRITNWMGILGRGLKIAPPEAPCSGFTFGKGVYFADCISLSACFAYPYNAKDSGIVALCEVSLGTINPLMEANCNANRLPAGKHSVQALGSIMPDPSTWVSLDDGLIVPCGKMVNSKVHNPPAHYNEFVVFDIRQIRLRYLVQLKYNSKY